MRYASSDLAILGLFADYFLVAAIPMSVISRIKIDFFVRFEMKDLATLDLCLGLRITSVRPKQLLQLSPSSYEASILTRFGMSDANPFHTPINTTTVGSLNTDYSINTFPSTEECP